MIYLGVPRRKLIGISCAASALNVFSFMIGCDSSGGGSSGGATSLSGGASGSGGLQSGGLSSSGGLSGGTQGAGGANGGGTPSGGSSGATGGQGGVPMNDPMCPAEEPTHEGTCFVGPAAVCSYEGTNCVCSSRQWDCVGCPSEFVLALNGKDCSGYEGEACRTCECPTGPEPKWSCLEPEFGTRACGSDGLVAVSQSQEDGCLLLSLWTTLTDCVGEASGDGYCVRRVQWIPGGGCDELGSGDEPFWTARGVTGTIQVEGDEEAPIVSLDLTIEYDPESAQGEPPPNDVIQVDSCVADCSSQGCQ
jgi:hypothetical protein